MSEMMIWTMFAIANMRHITGLDISKWSKCEKKKLQFPKVWKHSKSYIHSVRHVGNDDLNYVCYSWHDAHHRSSNHQKIKMCKTNGKFGKFENTVNLIYTVRHVGNDLNYDCHSKHDAHRRSSNHQKVKMCKTNCKFEKFENTVNLIYTVCAMSDMMI